MNSSPAQSESKKPDVGCSGSGTGETIVFLHGSAATRALWRRTAEAVRPLYHAVAPDLIGYGSSAAWPASAPYTLDAETSLLEPLLPCCDGKFHLVGHSYGGTVALHLALANPARVHTLTLIEPVFPAALRYSGETAAYDRLCGVRDRFAAKLTSGERETAMQEFIDFWAGEGSWAALPSAMRDTMLNSAEKIALDWQASFAIDPSLQALAALGLRTALFRGDRSPEPMRRLVDALHVLMPGSSLSVISGAGHLLPATHSSVLIQAITTQLHADAERRLR